jgi:hypothetical protein
MSASRTRRGQPLAALLLLLGSWVGLRAAMWQEPQKAWHGDALIASAGSPVQTGLLASYRVPVSDPAKTLAQVAPGPVQPAQESATFGPTRVFGPAAGQQTVFHSQDFVAASASGRMAVLAPKPSVALAQSEQPGLAPGLHDQTSQTQQGRWSADAWLFRRRASLGPPVIPRLFFPSYGASQAGAVLRYRLAPGSALRPTLYLRGAAALDGSREREFSAGLSLRPIRRIPVSLSAEARLFSGSGRTSLRPAAVAVTELAPVGLPLGLRGEAYGQAGYVGGRFATYFADGHLRADRGLARLGPAEMRLGGGVWGGIQKGAGRLDAGPSLVIGGARAGPAAMRLAADWRFRVAGNSVPGSGPALTLSAGF